MDCNSVIHDELKSMEESTCPFCDQQLVEVDEVVELCCDEQELENIDGMNTCVNCGKIYSYDYAAEYFVFDFYDNVYKIRRKSTYHRNYHIDNVMNSISFENNIQFTHEQINQIHKVFVEIDSVLHEVNDGRKRMIIIIIIIIKAYTALIQTVLSALQFINSIKYNKNINIQINIQSYGLNKKKKQTNKLTKDYMLI